MSENMSDNAERSKAEMLEAEEQEMKKELLEIKMYESWYTRKDMVDILKVINESKYMANRVNDDEVLHSSNNCNQGSVSKVNLTPESETQEHNAASQSTHWYRRNQTSSIREEMSVHGHNSPDFEASVTESRDPVYRGKNLENENICVKLQDNLNMRDSCSAQDSGMDVWSECEERLDRWKINPLDSWVSENDVPLPEPSRPTAPDRMLFKLCKEAQPPGMYKETLHRLNVYLKETIKFWHSHATDTISQRGSPIQVDLAKRNLDKESLTNIKTEQNQMEYTSVRDNETKSNKRKTTLTLSSSNTETYSNDEDVEIVKKRKFQSHRDSNESLHFHEEAHAADDNEKDENSNNDNAGRDFDNTEIDRRETESKRQTKEPLSAELVPSYPRRIAPPNVRKSLKRVKKHSIDMSPTSSFAHCSNEKRSAMSSVSNNEIDGVDQYEETVKKLGKDNVKTTSEDIVIRPLPIRSLSQRIKNECKVLQKINMEKQKKMEMAREEARKKEEEEKRKREEFCKKQIDERQRREKEKEEMEKMEEQKTKRWNNILGMKSQKKIKYNKEKLHNAYVQNESHPSEMVEEKNLFQENKEFASGSMEIDLTDNINCPICNESFPPDIIETHAASCEQYATESNSEYRSQLENETPPANVSSKEVLECNICSKYKTTNGIDYEDHVNYCLQRHQASSFQEHPTAIINIPDSPIRSYQPISEQTDSYIDYKGQFPTSNRTKAHSSKRRKL